MRSRTDRAAARRLLLERRHVGRRQRRRAAEQVLQDPLAAMHRRRAIRVRRDQQQAALPEQTATGIARNRHAPEVRAVDVRDAVVLRQPLVHERVVRIEQIQHRSVLAQDALEEHLRFPLEAPDAGCRRNPETTVDVGIGVLQIPEVEPLVREVGDQRARPRIREHPARLLLEHGRIVQLALDPPAVNSSSSGIAGPEEERQARRQLGVA